MSRTPAFRTSEIRPHMDVFSQDGTRVGMVVRVLPGPEKPAGTMTNLSGKPDERQFDGETIGPQPTRSVGNFGPATQSPERLYGADVLSGDSLGHGVMIVATLLGLFGRKTIPLDEVQTVSMERVVLRHPASAYE